MLDRVVQFMYTMAYDDNDEVYTILENKGAGDSNLSGYEFNDTHNQLMMHTEISAVAERLGIQKLKDLAKSKFEETLPSDPCGALFLGFPNIVRRVLQCTPPKDTGLRAMCVDLCAK